LVTLTVTNIAKFAFYGFGVIRTSGIFREVLL